MKRHRIAIFHLAFIYAGGGERLVLEEALGLEHQGFEVECYAPIIDSKNCFPELMSQLKVMPFIPRLPLWVPDIALLSILVSCIVAPLMFFKFRGFDFYFGANQPGAWIAYILGKINKKPYFIYLAQPTRLLHPRLIDQKTGLRIQDGLTFLNSITWLFKPLINYLDVLSIRGARVAFANGIYAKGLLEEVYNRKMVNCPAGAHIQSGNFTQELIEKRFKGYILIKGRRIKKPYILVTNRHFAQKKFENVIEAVKLLPKRYPIVFTGKITDYTKSLKKLYEAPRRRLPDVVSSPPSYGAKSFRIPAKGGAKEDKNESFLHFVDLLTEKELNKAYEQAAVYVYPAPEEDFGMGIVEAMSYGVPTVAFGNGGPTGIITHGEDGFLAKPFSIENLSEYIYKLLINRTLYKRVSYSAIQKVKNNFTYDIHNTIISNTILKYLSFYA